jgi:hypothetical protein
MPSTVPADVPWDLDDVVVVTENLVINVPPDTMTVDVFPDSWVVDVPAQPNL